MELFFLALLILFMAFALAVGFPVAFALPGSAILTILLAALSGWLFVGDPTAFFAEGSAEQWLAAGVTNLRSIYWEPDRDTLIAIPLFVFMGIMLQRSRIAEDLLITMARLFGPVRGGLGISVVLVGALLAATTGIVGATVVAMGLISLPAMLQHQYSKRLASGTIAAAGTLGQIIPPSIVLIILADQMASAVDQANTARKALYTAATGEISMPSEFDIASTSAGEMFLGAILPGLVLVGLYTIYIFIIALIRPRTAPAVPGGSFDWAFWLQVLISLIPPLTLIILVLGSILFGVATVNQAGAIGAAGATIMAGYRLYEGRRGAFTPALLALASLAVIAVAVANVDTNIKNIRSSAQVIGIVIAGIGVAGLVTALIWSGLRTLRAKVLWDVMLETAKTSSLVFVILMGAAMLTAAFRAFGGEEVVRNFLQSLPGGFWSQFAIVMAVIFLLGFFLDFIEIAVVVVPIVAPILLADPSANVLAVWLGVMIGLNLQTSFLTPPFGFALFYLRGVAPPEVTTLDIYLGVVPFIALQLLALVIVGFWPTLANYLPNRSSLLAETAPPPVNPRLQPCIEQQLFRTYAERRHELEAAIARMAAADLSVLPETQARRLREAIERAAATFSLVEQVQSARQALEEAAPAYRPLLMQVRSIERELARLNRQIVEVERDRERLQTAHPQATAAIAALTQQLAELRQAQDRLRDQIPREWQAIRAAFAQRIAAEKQATLAYRRNVDEAWQPVDELLAMLRDSERLSRLAAAFSGLDGLFASEPEVALARLATLSDELAAIAGTGALRAAVSRVRSALAGRAREPERVRTALVEAVALFDGEVRWRTQAASALLPELAAYAAAIRDTIGLRQQRRLPRPMATAVAACLSRHRDISIWF